MEGGGRGGSWRGSERLSSLYCSEGAGWLRKIYGCNEGSRNVSWLQLRRKLKDRSPPAGLLSSVSFKTTATAVLIVIFLMTNTWYGLSESVCLIRPFLMPLSGIKKDFSLTYTFFSQEPKSVFPPQKPFWVGVWYLLSKHSSHVYFLHDTVSGFFFLHTERKYHMVSQAWSREG